MEYKQSSVTSLYFTNFSTQKSNGNDERKLEEQFAADMEKSHES